MEKRNYLQETLACLISYFGNSIKNGKSIKDPFMEILKDMGITQGFVANDLPIKDRSNLEIARTDIKLLI